MFKIKKDDSNFQKVKLKADRAIASGKKNDIEGSTSKMGLDSLNIE